MRRCPGSGGACAGWTVQDVVAHLTGVNAFWRSSVLAGLAGTPTRFLADFDPAATPPLLIGPMRELAPSEVFAQFAASNDAFLATMADLDDAGWSMLAESPAGHVSIRLLAFHALWDCWVHERVIALPLGQTPALEADEVLSCLRYAAALGPALAITSGNATAGVFSIEAGDPDLVFALDLGDTVSVSDGAAPGAVCLRGDAVELLEALSLRAPLPASSPTEWRQLLTGLATAFDSDLDLI